MAEVDEEQLEAAVVEATGIALARVQAVLQLIAEGATVPFIARYRKERTGGLDEVQIRAITDAHDKATQLEARRAAIHRQLDELGVLTPELLAKLTACEDRQALEDLYLPYKPKRRSKATEAIERGLQPLADRILEQPARAHPDTEAARFVDPARGIPDAAAALAGATDIVVETLATDTDLKGALRRIFFEKGSIAASKRKEHRDSKTRFDAYEDHEEPVHSIPSHRYLALRRGAEEEVLDLRFLLDRDRTLAFVARRVGRAPGSPFGPQLDEAIKQAWSQRLKRSLETELSASLKERADTEAARIFADNLEHLLLAAPLGAQPVIGVDPGFRSGCKCAAIDATGNYLGAVTIHPHQGAAGKGRATEQWVNFVRAYPSAAVAVGNGTASRETEAFLREALAASSQPDLMIVSVSEAGASVYSASEVAREEFPELDLTLRGAISIARRLQDPLAELVKVEPQAIGVGQYQHDVQGTLLSTKLGAVVESCVNRVGVEVNTASASLLGYVAGLGPRLAQNITSHRETHGPFPSRAALRKVKGLGPRAFEQAAGFLRVAESDESLDRSAVHPERYELVRAMARDLGTTVAGLMQTPSSIESLDFERYASEEVGEPTLRDIARELKQPGRDPRSTFEPPSFRDDVQAITDLEVGMELEGVVTNVTAFGAFVDVGVHQDGLVHRSQFWRRVQDPAELVHVGERLKVSVLEVDLDRKRIGLKAHGR